MSTNFRDRTDAGHALANALVEYKGLNPLILAIPRGAVPMAKIIATELDGELDIILVRKLGAPDNPEFAVGAVDESGWCYISDYAENAGADDAYIAAEKCAQLKIMLERRKNYTGARSALDPKGRIVIVIDDGLATGATMIAALHAVRAKSPKKLICAVPVASADAARKVKEQADRLVSLQTPQGFFAVGQFYDDFPQVSDEEVIAALN